MLRKAALKLTVLLCWKTSQSHACINIYESNIVLISPNLKNMRKKTFFLTSFLGWGRWGEGTIGAFSRVFVLECTRIVRITVTLKNPEYTFTVVWALYRLHATVVPDQLEPGVWIRLTLELEVACQAKKPFSILFDHATFIYLFLLI